MGNGSVELANPSCDICAATLHLFTMAMLELGQTKIVTSHTPNCNNSRFVIYITDTDRAMPHVGRSASTVAGTDP
jgi:hypothetical protein